MGMQQWVSWYQRKIGTYDKQQWECTVEQRILHGLTHVPRKSARLKTELIDVDLVRGSSFPKAKPKHGLGTVARLGLQRLILLPAYSRWWIQQTSAQVYALLLALYFLQLLNMILFFAFAPLTNPVNDPQDEGSEPASTSDVLVPAFMMIILSIIHSQVVSTHGAISPQTHRSLRKRKMLKRRLPQMRTRPVFEAKASQDEDHERKCLLQVETISSTKPSFDCQKVNKNDGREWPWKRSAVECRVAGPEGIPVDDDGFESLNGNGSSDEPTVANQDLCDEDACDSASSIHGNASVTQHSQNNNSSDNLDCKPSVILGEEELCATSEKDNMSRLEKNASNLKDNVKRPTSNFGDEEPLKLFPLPPKPEDLLFKSQINADHASSSNLLQRRRSAPPSRLRRSEKERSRESGPRDADSDGPVFRLGAAARAAPKRRGSHASVFPSCRTSAKDESSFNSSCCDSDDDGDRRGERGDDQEGSSVSSPVASTSAAEWVGITTNSEDCSVSSEMDEEDANEPREQSDQPFAWEFEVSPTVILNPGCIASDKVSCTIWENRDVKKAELSVLDISSAIIARVEAMPDNLDYFYGGMVVSFVLGLVPALCRLTSTSYGSGEGVQFFPLTNSSTPYTLSVSEMSQVALEHVTTTVVAIMNVAFGETLWERTVMVICLVERWAMASLFLFLLAVAERTFKQRFLYAKLFSHLTSFRRARKSELPHFRLNKVRNIKTWLSVRSYLKKRGPQRSVDMVVSAAFIITLLLLSFLSVELLKDSLGANSQYNMEALSWCLVLVVFLLRFMTLGTKINSKYRNLAVLITEQINLYLQIEQKPNKKEELMVANSVLKLAADLIKELESPFKISGLSANPYLYNITKVVVLSALSGVLSEILGFKLKLHKIKIK